ncbi:MAG: tetratricopeptide repeat protein [Rikenellaceae bacterium]|nr:tetratricopeptide repeat protein [Rikenellaceae bacterium]MCL2692564.1 tetratricopeptide repeat protein [Rikenellaceae bacterium]
MATQKGKPTSKTLAKPAAQQQEIEVKMNNALGRTEDFLHRNGKSLLTVVLVLVLVVGGYFAYKHLYLAGRGERAAAAMFVAQQNLAQEMYEVALHGDGNNLGFLDVIAHYGSTPQGNIARHYAGLCFVKLGDFDSAMEYLERYRRVRGIPAHIVNAQNFGLRGDIHVQRNELDRAVEMYERAVRIGENLMTSPYYLKKMGLVHLSANRPAEAMNAFQRILDEYPASFEARDIEKYMGAAGQM